MLSSDEFSSHLILCSALWQMLLGTHLHGNHSCPTGVPVQTELEGFSGIRIVSDDILIVGDKDNEEEAIQGHDTKLLQFLNRCKEQNIKLNSNKLKLMRTVVPLRWIPSYLSRELDSH